MFYGISCLWLDKTIIFGVVWRKTTVDLYAYLDYICIRPNVVSFWQYTFVCFASPTVSDVISHSFLGHALDLVRNMDRKGTLYR